ncbi:MAG: hypothetical protein EZS28_017619 [Streblomastix strix]|uniref:Uncharacterized protein n=1 Tax=Streblomastix strix TaxID=222440 RepID=A0A5J4VVW6_9EUKA|nr:MAG: hypothetical protein EZS28_017619 [Streblomastix strix]
MASCANAVKYSIAYNEFKLIGDYSMTSFDPPFYLTPQYWKAKVEGYISQDKLARRPVDNNVKESDYDYFQKLFRQPFLIIYGS